MIGSPTKPRPVKVGRYRYSKLRWRLLVGALDALGTAGAWAFRRFRPPPTTATPRRILVVQLDHLGDAVLSTPLLAELRSAYPEAAIDVLASPSNHEVFDADPNVDRIWIAERTWFERKPDRWALATAVWGLGRALRGQRYDLGIDVRGDVLSVLVLALAGVKRRIGWSMGGGAFLLTDVARWAPGRHEVRSRLALLELLGIEAAPAPRVDVAVADEDRIAIARRLAEAWPSRRESPASMPAAAGALRAEATVPIHLGLDHSGPSRRRPAHDRPHGGPRTTSAPVSNRKSISELDAADWLHAGRFSSSAPLLAVHLGAGTAAKRWPARSWKALVERFLADGWRVVVVGGADDRPLAGALAPHDRLLDWTGSLTVTQTTALLERADLFIGADSGPAHLAASAGALSVVLFSGTNQPRQWRPWSRYALVLRRRVPCQPCHQKICPLADHPCMSGLAPERVHRAAMRWWSRTHRAESPHAPL